MHTLRMKMVSLQETTPDPLGFFEAVMLAGKQGEWMRVPTAAQRRHFGNAPFGKKRIKVEGSKVTAIWKVAFGQDFNTCELYWSQFHRAWVLEDGSKPVRQEFNA